MHDIPDLFLTQPQKKTQRLYSLYLTRLRTERRDNQLLAGCKQVRKYAIRALHPEWGYFTYSFEIETLCRLQNIHAAWRQLRRWERAVSGENLDIKAKAWNSSQLNWFFSYHPYLLYMMGNYRQAGRMLEALLSKLLKRRTPGMSYEVIWRVYKPVAEPRILSEVTLYHIYRKLGKELTEWRQWSKFIKGFDSQLFVLADVKRDELLRDASKIKLFYEGLSNERKRRLAINVSFGEHELIESEEQVQRSQKHIVAKIASLESTITNNEKLLRELFPALFSE